jgi:hypothetical protein
MVKLDVLCMSYFIICIDCCAGYQISQVFILTKMISKCFLTRFGRKGLCVAGEDATTIVLLLDDGRQ